MRKSPASETRVLAIDPTTKGFGFAVLEGPARLVDWGVREMQGESRDRSMTQVADLINRYWPDVVVLEDHRDRSSRRCLRIRKLIRAIGRLAARKGVQVLSVSRAAIRRTFSECGARTKHQIAAAVAKRLPELTPRLPRPRKPWMSEDYRMAIFDAVALALTFFDSSRRRTEQRKGRATVPMTHAESQKAKNPGH